LYKAKEQVSHSGLYRCTTCGAMVLMNAGKTLPGCPSRCVDAIWTFFNEKWDAPAGEIRSTTKAFAALDLSGELRQIPVGARLTEVDLVPARPSHPRLDPKLAAFHFDGRVHFGSADELFRKTRLISKVTTRRRPRGQAHGPN
jgi:hypothetical protein